MNQVQKIEKQLHTSSILICSNDLNKTFKSATWMRKTDQIFKILKKELYEGKNISAYNCSIFDFASYIHLQLQNCEGLKKVFQYGPVKLEQKMLTLLGQRTTHFKQFEVSILLNKNQKFSAKVSFSKKQLSIFIIHIVMDNLDINLQYQVRQKWANYQEIFMVKNDHPNTIFLFLDSNKTQFIKKLNKVKIFCHYGHHLALNFQSEDMKKLFMIEFLDFIYLQNRLIEHAEARKPNIITLAIMQNDVNNLFASTEAFSNPHTPQVPERVLQDIRNIVFTPNPTFEIQIRQHGFVNFQNFIHNQSHKTLPKIVQNLKTTETIKEQQAQEQSQSKRRQKINTNQNKSHQFIFAANKSKKQSQNKLAINSIKSGRFSTTNNQSRTFLSRHKSVQNRIISYQELMDRNRFLEERNQKLEEQNIKLKERLTTFITFGHRQNKEKNYSIPEFLKTRQINKSKQHRNSNTVNPNHAANLGRVSEGILDHRQWKVRNTRMTSSKNEETKEIRNSISLKKSKNRISFNIFDVKEPGKQYLINSRSSKFFKSLL